MHPWSRTAAPGTASPRGEWQRSIDVRAFVQRDHTPYEGDAAFLAGPTEKTLETFEALERE